MVCILQKSLLTKKNLTQPIIVWGFLTGLRGRRLFLSGLNDFDIGPALRKFEDESITPVQV